ncbi:MAG: hypothetical protein QOI80_323, partial [Solirubrobacteraceae bacterium]|nr:hypothetical protein [Solirubrobacteraceae bacterium]
MRGIDDAGRLRAHYQPIVDARTRATVAYEALARDETGVFPAARFAAARVNGRLAELDAECLRAALTGAAGLDATLFVNVEPESFDGPPAIDVAPARVMVELTERGLTTRPAELLLAVERVRRLGWGIAIDDVGVDWRSIALMPFLRPDVIKLDRGLLRDADSRQTAQVVNGVRAHIDAHGGLLLAEGIVEEPDADCARALGATLGQGFLYGRPSTEHRPANVTGVPLPIFTTALPHPWRTPFEVASARRPVRHGTMPLLASITRELERQAASGHRTSLLISSFPDNDGELARINALYDEL